jgi:hypothetical protein
MYKQSAITYSNCLSKYVQSIVTISNCRSTYVESTVTFIKYIYICTVYRNIHLSFYISSHNCGYWLLAQWCLSICPAVRLSTWNSLPTGRIYMKFEIWNFSKLDRVDRILIKSDSNNRRFTWRLFIFSWILNPHVAVQIK